MENEPNIIVKTPNGSLELTKLRTPISLDVGCKAKLIMKNKTFIIAELSANHNGDINIALETVRAAKRSGADAIKLQTYTADTLTIDCKNDYFKINHGTAWDGEYLYDLLKEHTLHGNGIKKFLMLQKKKDSVLTLLHLTLLL